MDGNEKNRQATDRNEIGKNKDLRTHAENEAAKK